MSNPKEDDIITNSDEAKRLPDENPEPLEGIKKEEAGTLGNKPENKKEENSKATKKDEYTPKPGNSNTNIPHAN